jgi:lipoic acid synthetase
MAGPLVRSSYRAGRLYAQAVAHRGDIVPAHLRHLLEAGTARQEVSALLAH